MIFDAIHRFRSTHRFAVNWWTWGLRKALLPRLRLPCWIITKEGSRFYLGRDPIDDRILEEVCDGLVDVYYPRLPETMIAGKWILDVGAHHGFYAVEALRRYPGSRLIAVEPDPDACRLIGRNLAANDFLERAEIVETGVGGEPSVAVLKRSPLGSWGDRTIPFDVTAKVSRGDRLVPILDIGTILKGRTPCLVKCNAEGAEFGLFPQLFSEKIFPEVIVLIVHPAFGPVEELLRLFRTTGYRVENVRRPGQCFHCWLTAVNGSDEL